MQKVYKYQELIKNPPKIKVKKGAKEVCFLLISCMCDNRHIILFKKNESGEFQVSAGSQALSNFQMKSDFGNVGMDLRWAADEENWDEVVRIINSGTEKVAEVKCR